jgi:hypothetical protein
MSAVKSLHVLVFGVVLTHKLTARDKPRVFSFKTTPNIDLASLGIAISSLSRDS